MTSRKFVLPALTAVLAALVLLVSCGNDNKDSSTGTDALSKVSLSFTNLKPLTGTLNYQAWAIEYYDGEYYGYPLGIFNINDNGQMVSAVGDTVISGDFTVNLDADAIYAVGLSIEASSTPVTVSSYAHILGGLISSGQADLTVSNSFGMNMSLDNITGRYILATPTDTVTSNEKSGIWFLDTSTGISFNGLSLPTLGSGWKYEAWVKFDTLWVSTGKFTSVSAADESNTYGSAWSAPAFPGQDFLINAPSGLTFPTDLSGSEIMVTVEPLDAYDLDKSKPFYLKVLSGQVPAGAADHATYFLNKDTGGLPTGTAHVTAL
ncbi:hypothetical protein LLH00_19550 [bacterium]|nr:hypothetical protein [bacterium]